MQFTQVKRYGKQLFYGGGLYFSQYDEVQDGVSKSGPCETHALAPSDHATTSSGLFSAAKSASTSTSWLP